MKELMRSELFVPRYAIPLEEERELALRRLQVRCTAPLSSCRCRLLTPSFMPAACDHDLAAA